QQRVALRFYVVTAPIHLLVRVVVVDVGRSRRVVHAVVVLVPAVANVRLVVVRTVIVGPRRIVPPARIVLAIAVLGVRRRGAASHGQTAEHGYDHQGEQAQGFRTLHWNFLSHNNERVTVGHAVILWAIGCS